VAVASVAKPAEPNQKINLLRSSKARGNVSTANGRAITHATMETTITRAIGMVAIVAARTTTTNIAKLVNVLTHMLCAKKGAACLGGRAISTATSRIITVAVTGTVATAADRVIIT